MVVVIRRFPALSPKWREILRAVAITWPIAFVIGFAVPFVYHWLH